MRKIILSLAASLDGFIEGPDREIDWIPNDPETAAELNAFAREIDAVMYGRVSYELFGQYVPGADAPQDEKSFYEAVSRMRKYVFSQTRTAVGGDAVLIRDNIRAQVEAIKRQPGKDIWLFGGASLITTFLNLDLIDRFEIAVVPILLGEGNAMFQDITARKPLRLVKTKTYPNGIVWLTYELGRG